MILAHQVRTIWVIVGKWVWDADMPGALVVEEMGLGKTFTLFAVAMLCKLVTERVVLGLPMSILWGNTLEGWAIVPHNDIPSIVGETQKWYPLQRLNSVPCHLLEIQSTQSHGHAALKSAHKPIMVVTIPGVAKTFKTVIHKTTQGIDFKLVNLVYAENASFTHEDPIISIDKPENQCNIHLVWCDSLISRGKRSSYGRLSHWSWSLGYLMSLIGPR